MKPARITYLLIAASLALGGSALAQQAPAQDPELPAFLLGPSDVIRVWVWNEVELTTSVAVRPDGKVSLPLVGEVDVAGRTPVDVEEEIKAKLGPFLKYEPNVVVIVEQINSPSILVVGEVRAPNLIIMRQPLTVLDAIAMAGGFTEFANMGDVALLRREGTRTRRIRLNLKDYLEDGTAEPVSLQPGDTVYVKR